MLYILAIQFGCWLIIFAEGSKVVYLHDLLEGSELQLPAVQELPRVCS